MEERLQNILSHRGVASRRGAAAMIEEGRVSVNGAVVREPGARFDPSAAEIAKILNRNESTVRSDLKRARERLKEILKEEYDFG